MTANIIRCKNPWFIYTKFRPPPTCACLSLYNCYYRSSLFDTRRQTITSVSITTIIIIVIRRYVLYRNFMQFISLADSQRTVVMCETFRRFLHLIIYSCLPGIIYATCTKTSETNIVFWLSPHKCTNSSFLTVCFVFTRLLLCICVFVSNFVGIKKQYFVEQIYV